jgi:hypothetical protein
MGDQKVGVVNASVHSLQRNAKNLISVPAVGDVLITDEVIKRVVGAAEGNLTAYGKINPNYYGHTDPGDSKANKGWCSMSPQREGISGNISIEEADRICLEKEAKPRMRKLIKQAQDLDFDIDLLQFLNAVDLAIQSPEASLGWSDGLNKGYISNLLEMMNKGLTGNEAILSGRVESFKNSSTGRYEAWVGKDGLTHDQKRRMNEIEDTVKALSEQGKLAKK